MASPKAIALAQAGSGCLLLLDDSQAPRVAERLGLRRTGTLVMLKRAKHAGLIESLRTEIDSLRINGIHLRQALIDSVLRSVGE